LTLQFVVAEKLGYTLAELQERMTPEELMGWGAFLDYKNDREREAMEKSRRRR
jgi:hypothetical protein